MKGYGTLAGRGEAIFTRRDFGKGSEADITRTSTILPLVAILSSIEPQNGHGDCQTVGR
jgi:hypothetical protein